MEKVFAQDYNGYRKRELLVSSRVCYGFGFSEFLSRHIDEVFISNKRALDVGVGAGTITLDLLDYGLHVDGIDLNYKAVEICRKNLIKYGYDDCIIKKENIAEFETEEKYDFIVSNPPISIFKDVALSKELDHQIKNDIIDFDAFLFLTNDWCDNDGLDLVDHCFIKGDKLLNNNGKIIIVCGNPYEDVLSLIVQKSKKYKYTLVKEILEELKAIDIGLDDENLNTFVGKIFVFEKIKHNDNCLKETM